MFTKNDNEEIIIFTDQETNTEQNFEILTLTEDMARFKGNLNDIKTLAKILKNKCGVGGSIKNDEILIQGDMRDKITQILIEMGHDVKRIGG